MSTVSQAIHKRTQAAYVADLITILFATAFFKANEREDRFISCFPGGRTDYLRGNTESRNLSHYSNKIHTFNFNGVSENFTPFGNREERMRCSE